MWDRRPVPSVSMPSKSMERIPFMTCETDTPTPELQRAAASMRTSAALMRAKLLVSSLSPGQAHADKTAEDMQPAQERLLHKVFFKLEQAEQQRTKLADKMEVVDKKLDQLLAAQDEEDAHIRELQELQLHHDAGFC